MIGREKSFGLLRDGLLAQDFPGVRHIVATQNISCDYLPPHRIEAAPACPHGVRTHVVRARNATRPQTTSHHVDIRHSSCPWSLIVHDMLEHVSNSSWVMVLDDDVQLIRNDHISNVMRHVLPAPTDTVFLQPTYVGPENGSIWYTKSVWPQGHWRDPTTAHQRVDMSNLVFHRSMASRILLSGHCGEDKELFRKLLAAGGKLRILNLTQPVGVWANYKGAGVTNGF